MNRTDKPLLVSLTIIRYPKQYVVFALLAMAVHRLPLWANRKIYFWKLLGCGKGGGFSKKPDWQQWGILAVRDGNTYPDTHHHKLLKTLYGGFIAGWYRMWRCEISTVLLEPIAGHGLWDGGEPFGHLPEKTLYTEKIAVLTRATISIRKLKRFWAHVDEASAPLAQAQGLIRSVSIGEVPFIKQATFSIWRTVEDMKAFAYGIKQHTDVIQKTRKEKWYSEELFARFKVLKEYGKVNSENNGQL